MEYQEKFESLRTLMLVKNPKLPEGYFIFSFVSGLKEELKPTVHMMKPPTLFSAFEVAMLQEQSLELSSKRFRTAIKWNGDPGGQSSKSFTEKAPNHNRTVGVNKHKTGDSALEEPKKISAQEIQCRRNLGLCFKCGEKYGVGHQCNLKQFSFMLIDEDEESTLLDSPVMPEEEDEDTGAILDVCLHALTTQLKRNIITLVGSLKNTPVRILIDTVSAHSYVHCNLVLDLSLAQQETKPFMVTLADGKKATSRATCLKVP